MSEEDMRQMLAGLPVQIPGQPNPALNSNPSFPPLSQAEINQIMANIQMPPTITQAEIDRIFESAPKKSLTTEEMNQIFERIPPPSDFSAPMNPLPQENQTFENLPQY